MTTLPEPDVSNETVVEMYHRLAALYDWFITPLQAGTRHGLWTCSLSNVGNTSWRSDVDPGMQ